MKVFKQPCVKALICCALTAIFCFSLLPLPSVAAENSQVVYRFDNAKIVSEFVSHGGGNVASYDAKASALRFDFENSTDPISVWEIPAYGVDLSLYKYVKIKLKAQCASTQLQFFFSTYKSPDITEGKMVNGYYDSYLWNEVILDMSSHKDWNSFLNTLRFDPASTSFEGEYMLVEYIGFFKTEEDAQAYAPLTDEQKAENDAYHDQLANSYVNSPYYTDGAMVYRFDSYNNIIKLTSAYAFYGMSTSLVDGSMLCKAFFSPVYIPFRMDNDMTFNADVFKYMKIKYFSHMNDQKFTFQYNTPETNGEITVKRTKNRWVETVVDLTDEENWAGLITGLRMTVAENHHKVHDDYCFVEYIAFFKTAEEAEAFGGLTEAQQNGTDGATAYKNGDRYSFRYKGLPTFDTANNGGSDSSSGTGFTSGLPIGAWIGIIAGGVVALAAAAIATIVAIRKRKRS